VVEVQRVERVAPTVRAGRQPAAASPVRRNARGLGITLPAEGRQGATPTWPLRPDVTLTARLEVLRREQADLEKAIEIDPNNAQAKAQLETLRARGDALAAQSGPSVEVVEVRSTIGGGSLPGETLQSIGLALTTGSANRTLNALRTGTPAVVGRIEADRVILDLRTVPSSADRALLTAVRAALR